MNGPSLLTNTHTSLQHLEEHLQPLNGPLSLCSCREVRRQPTNQTEEEHVEGSKHGGGSQEAEGEEEAGPQIVFTSVCVCVRLCVVF